MGEPVCPTRHILVTARARDGQCGRCMAPGPYSPYNEATDGPPERGGLPAATKRLEDSMEHLTQLVVSESDLGNIARILGRLTMETGGSHVLLLDKSGQLVSAQGQTDQRDIIALGALLAGAFSSSRQGGGDLGGEGLSPQLAHGGFRSIHHKHIREPCAALPVVDP